MAFFSASRPRARTAGSGLLRGSFWNGPEIHMLAIWIPASRAASPMRLTSSALSDGEISSPKRTSIPSNPAFFAWRNFSASGMSCGKITEQMLLTKRFLVDCCAAALEISVPAAVAVINCLLFMRSPHEFSAAEVRKARWKATLLVLILFLLNIWIVRELLTADFVNQMGSIEGTHIAVGRFA